MTIKQRLFIRNYFKTLGMGAQSARLAGYSERSAKEIAYQNMQKKHISIILDQKFKEIGLD